MEEQIAEGDRVVSLMTVEGTNDGPFLGMPPTGKRMSARATSVWRVSGGRLVDETITWDALGAFQQLGLMPGGGAA